MPGSPWSAHPDAAAKHSVEGKGTAACDARVGKEGPLRRGGHPILRPASPDQSAGRRSDVVAAERMARITASGGESLVR